MRYVLLLLVVATLGCTQTTEPEIQPATLKSRLPVKVLKTPQERESLFSENFSLVSSTSQLPRQCKAIFAALTGEPHFSLVDPGKPYQGTDVANGFPTRRMILAGTGRNTCFIDYEHGGIGWHVEFVLIQLNPPALLWGGPGFMKANEFQSFKSRVIRGEFQTAESVEW